MINAFVKFQNEFNGKTFNEILGCAKTHHMGLTLVKDVEDYNNNTIACEVRYYPNADKYDYEDNIVVECILTDGVVYFSLPNAVVHKFGRQWEKILKFDENEINPRDSQYKWWEMLSTEEGKFFMNNYDGEMVFVNKNGIEILKCDF